MEMMTMLLILLVLACLSLGLATSLIHLRRRHRALRHKLREVADERNDLKWKLYGGPRPAAGAQ